MLKIIWQKIINTLFPQECLLCQKPKEILCEICLKNIPILLPNQQPKLSDLDQIICCGDYQSLAKILHAYKYYGLTDLAKPLAQLLASQFKISTDTIIIPLPSHPRRIRERGFDHIKLIANELSKLTTLTVINNVLIRNKYTVHQVGLKREARLNNLKDCFSLKNPYELTDKTIFLLDDVVTTGASLMAAAKIIRTAKVKKIIGLALAYEKD